MEPHGIVASDSAGSSVGRGALCKGASFFFARRGGNRKAKVSCFLSEPRANRELLECQRHLRDDPREDGRSHCHCAACLNGTRVFLVLRAEPCEPGRLSSGTTMPSTAFATRPVASLSRPENLQKRYLVTFGGWWLCLASHGSAEGHGPAAAERLPAAALPQHVVAA